MKILKEFTSDRFAKKRLHNLVTYGLSTDYQVFCRFDDTSTWWDLHTTSLEELTMIADEFRALLNIKAFT